MIFLQEMPDIPDVGILHCGVLPHHKMGIKVCMPFYKMIKGALQNQNLLNLGQRTNRGGGLITEDPDVQTLF